VTEINNKADTLAREQCERFSGHFAELSIAFLGHLLILYSLCYALVSKFEI